MWTEGKMPKSRADAQNLPEGYHMTELGPLPQEWRVVELRRVVEQRTLKSPRRKKCLGMKIFYQSKKRLLDI